MSISDQLQALQNTRLELIASLRDKNIEVLDTDYLPDLVSKVKDINSGHSDGWKPHPDWYDINNIIDNDTGSFENKLIVLLMDNTTSLRITEGTIVGYKTSDDSNTFYESTGGTISFFGDGDKSCSLGYKTRWVILYFETAEAQDCFEPNSCSLSALWIEIRAARSNITFNTYSNLQYITPTIVMNISNRTGNPVVLYSLESDMIFTSEIPIITHFFNLNPKVKKVTLLKDLIFDSGMELSVFADCASLKEINGVIDISSGYNHSSKGFLNNLYNLETVNVKGLHQSLNLANNVNLSKSSILYMINNALDVTANPKTLTLGNVNLNKLTDDDKKIATDKGWILS